MLRYVLLVVAVALLALGADGLYHSWRSRHQAVLGCEDFIRSRPPSLFVRVEGCEIDPAAVSYRSSDGQVQELFFPARVPGISTTRLVSIVVATRDPAALQLAQSAFGSTGATDPQKATATMTRILAALGGPVISGTVRAGLLHRLRLTGMLSRSGTPLAPDAAVIDLHTTRDPKWSAIATAAGLLLLWVGLAHRLLVRRRPVAVDAGAARESFSVVAERLLPYTASIQSAQEPSPPVQTTLEPMPLSTIAQNRPKALPPGPPESSERVSLPALMLLNLDAAATVESIETAPPLGRRDDVAARLRAVLPSIAPDAAGRLTAGDADHRLECDLGRSDTVHTVIVRARGRRGVELLKEVMKATRWRAFVPKTGRFVTTDQLDALPDRRPQPQLVT